MGASEDVVDDDVEYANRPQRVEQYEVGGQPAGRYAPDGLPRIPVSVGHGYFLHNALVRRQANEIKIPLTANPLTGVGLRLNSGTPKPRLRAARAHPSLPT